MDAMIAAMGEVFIWNQIFPPTVLIYGIRILMKRRTQ